MKTVGKTIMTKHSAIRVSGIALVLALAAQDDAALAQAQAAQAQSEEIVVTARRRAENVEKVPISSD